MLPAAPIFFCDNRGHQRPLLMPGSALPGSPGHAGLLRALSDLWEERACTPNPSCSSGFGRWMRRGSRLPPTGARVGVSHDAQARRAMVWTGLATAWGRAVHTRGWEQGGFAPGRAPASLLESSNSHSAPPAPRGPVLPSAPKQKPLTCGNLRLIRSEMVKIGGWA